MSARRLLRRAEDQIEEVTLGRGVQQWLYRLEFVELLADIHHRSRWPTERSLFLPDHRLPEYSFQMQRQKNVARFRCDNQRIRPYAAIYRWFWQEDIAACLTPMYFRSSHRSTTCPVRYVDQGLSL